MSYPTSSTPRHDQPAPDYGRAPAASAQGTPLGRIVLGVFLGLLAWSAVMCVVGVILLSVAGSMVEDAFDDAGTTSTGGALSGACKANLDAGGDGTADVCAGDDSSEVFRYVAEQSTR